MVLNSEGMEMWRHPDASQKDDEMVDANDKRIHNSQTATILAKTPNKTQKKAEKTTAMVENLKTTPLPSDPKSLIQASYPAKKWDQ